MRSRARAAGEVEGVDVESLADVLDAIGAQDVEGGGADAGHPAGLLPDPAVVFAHIPNIMVPVLNTPVRAHGVGEGLGIETDLAGVTADLLARRPQAGCPSRRSGARPGRRRRSAAATRRPTGVEDLDEPMFLATPPVSWLSKGWYTAQSLASVSCKVGWFCFTWTSRPFRRPA